jgi:1-acyl-sn-glycerol-3-phosphate acyltransferase
VSRLLRVAYQPYKWLVLGPIVAVDTLLFGTLTIPLALVSRRLAHFACGCLWARLNATLTPAFVKVRGRENLEADQSYVIIANHQSAFDIWVIYGWLWIDFRWVMKKELGRIPGLGWGSKVVGHIFIDRTNRKQALATLEDAKSKLRDGTSVVFFPEGTRSRTAEMLPFKKGAFRFARDLGLPILPITINGTSRILPGGTLDLMPGRAELIIHPPIRLEDSPEGELDGLMAHARAVIDSARVP